MKVLERYILRRALLMFAAALLWTMAIVWTTQVLTRIDLVTDSGQSALAFFKIATLILPSVIPIVVPFAVAIAVSQTLAAMNTDSELVVVNASGASRLVTIRPILILAAAASVLVFGVHNFVEPYSRQTVRELVAAANGDLLAAVVQEGSFRKVEEGLFVQVGDRLPDSTLGGIFVADSRTPGTDLIYYAKSGSVVKRDGKELLVMRDGEVHRKQIGGEISTIEFQSYAFDLSFFAAASAHPTLLPKDRTLAYLLDPDPNDVVWKARPQNFRAEIHKRMTEWLFPTVFALLALAVSGDARSHREARVNPIVMAITLSLFVRWLGYFSVNQNQTVAWIWPLVYAVPITAAAVAAWFIATHRSLELPVALAERLFSTLRRVADRLVFMRLPGTAAAGGAG